MGPAPSVPSRLHSDFTSHYDLQDPILSHTPPTHPISSLALIFSLALLTNTLEICLVYCWSPPLKCTALEGRHCCQFCPPLHPRSCCMPGGLWWTLICLMVWYIQPSAIFLMPSEVSSIPFFFIIVFFLPSQVEM